MSNELIDEISEKLRIFASQAEHAFPAPENAAERLGYIKACEDFQKASIPKVNYGWLIESKIQDHNGPYYLCVQKVAGYRFEWKPGHEKAIRFCRKEDAESVIDAVRELSPDLFPYIVPMPQAVEHAWSGV